ncbi:MAG: ATP-binding cassette domain-containing protein [Caldilineaceae bacterium]
MGQPAGDIRYHDITFGYDEHRKVKNLSLSIAAGETVAFVGPSGRKSTLCSLLPRFYELDGGSITIDGIDIQQMTLVVAPPDRASCNRTSSSLQDDGREYRLRQTRRH